MTVGEVACVSGGIRSNSPAPRRCVVSLRQNLSRRPIRALHKTNGTFFREKNSI
jgi:hypothetical protein